MTHFSEPPLFPLTPLWVGDERAQELTQAARDFLSLDLNEHQCADVEMLACGAYSPLRGFMGRAETESVRNHMQLLDGQFWPLPLTLTAPAQICDWLQIGQALALRDAEGFLLAVLNVSEVWRADDGQTFVAGAVEVVAMSQHVDYKHLRLEPQQVRERWRRQVGSRLFIFQPESVIASALHRAVRAAARAQGAHLLWQALTGAFHGNESIYFARIQTHLAQQQAMANEDVSLGLLPALQVPTNLAGALFKALIARNFGATHVGLAGISADALAPYQERAGIIMAALPEASPSEAALIQAMQQSDTIPEEVATPEMLAPLRNAFPLRCVQGFCIFFTGLSGAGKSTLAKALMLKLLEESGRQVSLLDGDRVRKNLSAELGFSREHREMNVKRIAYVASEIVKHRGIAICAPIAPYAAMRHDAREKVERYGGFFEVYVATPIAVCEARDRKGLYAKARAGLVKEFTGVSDPYEAPSAPELSLDTTHLGVDEAVHRILQQLRYQGYLK